jgi:hypothetical protein
MSFERCFDLKIKSKIYLPRNTLLTIAMTTVLTGRLAKRLKALGEAIGTLTLSLENLSTAKNGRLALILPEE